MLNNNDVIMSGDICRINGLFKTISQSEFTDLINNSIRETNIELLISLLYYVLLFRKYEFIKDLMTGEQLEVQVMERFIYYAIYYAEIMGTDVDEMVFEIMSMFPNEKKLELLTKSKIIRDDYFIHLKILSTFDTKSIDIFLGYKDDLRSYIGEIISLPEKQLQFFLSKNMQIFEYFVMYSECFGINKEFEEKYKQFVKIFQNTSKLKEKIQNIIFADAQMNFSEKIKMVTTKIINRDFCYHPERNRCDHDFLCLNLLCQEKIISYKESNLVQEIIVNPCLRDIKLNMSHYCKAS